MTRGGRVGATDTSAATTARQGRPLGILAGGGPLPIELAEAGTGAGRPIHIVAIEGFADPDVARFPHERVSIGQLGRIIASFKRAGTEEIAIAGTMQRPNLAGLRIDWGFVRNLPTVLALTRGGDDSVLRRVVRFFEGNGFKVIGASDIAPDLLAPTGLIAARAPTTDDETAIRRAAALITALGPFDIGQGVVAGPTGVVVVEGIKGTDAMLRDLGPGGIVAAHGKGAVLVKLAKPGQEMRIDLPTIGPETVRLAAAGGLAGIGIGAGGAIVLQRQALAECADREGLFVTGFETGGNANVRSDAAPSAIAASPALHIVARRAPTPGQRRDIALGRQVLGVLRAHEAGYAALVAREHVLAVSGSIGLADFTASQGTTRTWGRWTLGERRGVLIVDGAAGDGTAEAILDVALFSAAKRVRLAGIVVLAPLADEARRADIVAWANEAGVFLMWHGDEP